MASGGGFDEFLMAYDRQLRTDAEAASAIAVERIGPLRLITFAGGAGFVTYPPVDGVDARRIPQWVGDVVDRFRRNPKVNHVEWKTRGHDRLPGLHEALTKHGFVAGEAESIMVGRAELLAGGVSLPPGVRVRKIHREGDVRSMVEMADAAFHSANGEAMVAALVSRLARGDGMELWVAEADGQIICTGRLEPVADSDFAGIWGGATLHPWRRRGIYRALTAERARSALRLGKTLIHSDSTEHSRPILERSGLRKISTTTPYLWRNDPLDSRFR